MVDVVPHLWQHFDVFERDTGSRFSNARYSFHGVDEPFLKNVEEFSYIEINSFFLFFFKVKTNKYVNTQN